MSQIKISILLPTRNRLDLTKTAIETVLRQNYQNWEIVLADNHSQDDYAGYVSSINDERIVYTRSDSFVSVTKNWNRALRYSTGDYVAMLGDDDGLTPDYIQCMLSLIEKFGSFDFVYHGAYHYLYPNALSHHPESKLTDVTVYSRILQGIIVPKLLSKKDAHWAARCALNMKVVYAFNMQHFLFRKQFIADVEQYGPFFQGPFPDYYAANMSMFLGRKIILYPKPLTIIGISPKSYGNYHYNREEKKGTDFLNADEQDNNATQQVIRNLIPGLNINSSWLISVSLVKENLKHVLPKLKLGLQRYRLFQMHEMLQSIHTYKVHKEAPEELRSHLLTVERITFDLANFLLSNAGVMQKPILMAMKWAFAHLQYTHLNGNKPWEVVSRYQNLLEVYENIDSGR